MTNSNAPTAAAPPPPTSPSSAQRLPFEGKVVLITGTTSGIGLHLAAQLSSQGASLLLFNRRVNQCEPRIRALLLPPQPHASSTSKLDLPELSAIEEEVDISDLLDVREALDALALSHPDLKVDILINNAGCALGGGRRFWEQSMKEIHSVIGTNVLGTVHITQEVLKRFMVPRRAGTILTITSAAAREPCYPNSGEAVGHATKAFLESFVQSVRRETVGTGVRVLALRPGRTETERWGKMVDGNGGGEDVAGRLEGLPTLKPDEVASAAVWMLLAPDAISVQELTVTATGEHGVGCVDRYVPAGHR